MEFLSEIFTLIVQSMDIILHLDRHMALWALNLGPLIYIVVFLIILGETGFIALPFLPGDSLLFALGALTITNTSLEIHILIPLLIIAAILGGFINYSFGTYLNKRVLKGKKNIGLNRSHLEKAQAFYEKHGTKAIFIARFIPIIRTFAPFVAGMCRMDYRKFILVNISGGIFWIFSMTYLGRLFGNLPLVKNNFGLIIPAIIIVSAAPIVIEVIKKKRAA